MKSKKVIDLTHTINEDAPRWCNGGEKYTVTILTAYKTGGYYSRSINIAEHYGTHIDAPCHLPSGKLSVNMIPTKKLISQAVVIDVKKKVKNNSNYELTPRDILDWEKNYGKISNNSVVLMRTGWGKFWKDRKKYLNQDQNNVMNFPGFSAEAISFLVKQRKINGVGVETLSIDVGNSHDFFAHHVLFKSNKYALENLANLDLLPVKGVTLIVAPLKIEDGSGSPARVFAVVK